MVKINELNTNKIKKTGNSKLYKNFLKLFMAGLLSTTLTGCAPEEQITDPVVVDPADPVEEKTELELLAEEYEFLQWHLDASTTKTVDGVTYDLTSLKQQYGDLYRFVEPLSKEEVEYRFQYLAEYFAAQAEKGDQEEKNGGLSFPSDTSYKNFNDRVKIDYKLIIESNDEKLEKFSEYYYYLEKTGRYYSTTPDSFLTNDSYKEEKIIDKINIISSEDKEWFVRNYMFEVDLMLDILKKNNEEPVFTISTEQKTR